MQKIIVILGQTATGKSDFAVEVAHILKDTGLTAEVISADSRQVYTGMNLGTGKITKKEMRRIPHHLLDVASPSRVFSVAQFKKLTDKRLKEMAKNNIIPIICGGTGFYIDAVVDNILLPQVPPNKALRNKLAKYSAEQLYLELLSLDPIRAETIDPFNKVRLIRAIEIAQALGSVPVLTTSSTGGKYDVLKIGLVVPDEVLKEKIHIRLLARIKKGMLREIQKLHNDGLSWKRLEMLGLEYRYGALYLQKKIAKDDMLTKLESEIWHYAKRQKTWFKRDTATVWIDPRKVSDKKKAVRNVQQFLK